MKIRNMMVVSLDGKVASHPFENTEERLRNGLTNRGDQELLRGEILRSDAVVLGANSVRTEGRVLEVINSQGRTVPWFVYTRKGLEKDLPFWKQESIPKYVVSPTELETEGGVENLCYGNEDPGFFLVKWLKENGFKNVLVLGGREINKIFYEKDLIDEIKLTLAPVVIGQGDLSLTPPLEGYIAKKFELKSCEEKDSYVFLHYVASSKT